MNGIPLLIGASQLRLEDGRILFADERHHTGGGEDAFEDERIGAACGKPGSSPDRARGREACRRCCEKAERLPRAGLQEAPDLCAHARDSLSEFLVVEVRRSRQEFAKLFAFRRLTHVKQSLHIERSVEDRLVEAWQSGGVHHAMKLRDGIVGPWRWAMGKQPKGAPGMRDDRRGLQFGKTVGEGHASSQTALAPGKRTLVEQVQRTMQDAGTSSPASTHSAAAYGVSGSSHALPHAQEIQRRFGRHDVSTIQAHTDTAATAGSQAMNAQAFAASNHVAFASTPDLRTAAHEAAHVVQQRGGVQLKSGVGQAGDEYERHADEVADTVVQGKSAEALLDQHAGQGTTGHATAIQRQEAPIDAGAVPLPAGVPPEPPDPFAAEPATMQDAELGQAYVRALTGGDTARAQAIDEEMDRRTGMGTAVPRGPQPVTSGSGAVTADVGLSLLDNMAEGKPPLNRPRRSGDAHGSPPRGLPIRRCRPTRASMSRSRSPRGRRRWCSAKQIW
ncbi:MAG TPA: DUF4157 domain-containing protein [Kofleriaceae bacterium]